MPDPSTLFGVDLASVRDRLRLLDYFTLVDNLQGGAEAITGAAAFTPPAAFVSIASENYERNRYATGGHGQRANVTLSVLLCIPAERADNGVGDEVEQARKVVLAQLAGWQPDGAQTALEAVRYQVRLIDDGLIWPEWQFRTSFDLMAAG